METYEYTDHLDRVHHLQFEEVPGSDTSPPEPWHVEVGLPPDLEDFRDAIEEEIQDYVAKRDEAARDAAADAKWEEDR